jgi:hypothetical protein
MCSLMTLVFLFSATIAKSGLPADFPLADKVREKLASGFYTTVECKVSNTGVITGKASLSNQHALLGYGAMWVVILSDKDGNVLWCSKLDRHTIGVGGISGEKSSKVFKYEFPKALVDEVGNVDIGLSRYEKNPWKTIMAHLEKTKEAAQKVQDILKLFN